MTHAESEEEGLKCLLCSRPGNTQLTYLGGVTAQVQAHQLCIKFAKGIKNKKSVIGNTRLQVSSQEEPTLSLIDESLFRMKLRRTGRRFVFSARGPEPPPVMKVCLCLIFEIFLYSRLLETILPRPVPPAVQPGSGGDQQTRHLHVLLLDPLQGPA